MAEVLEFRTMGEAVVHIDLEICDDCATKACIKACNQPFMGEVLKLEGGRPSLAKSPAEIERGGCTDCVACELDCELYGKGALSIQVPMPDLGRYLEELEFKGIRPVYLR